MADLTHRQLDCLVEDYLRFGQLYGSDEHQDFVVDLLEAFPALIEAARKTIPAPVLAEIHIPGFLPRASLNSREHFMARAKRVKKEHEIVALALLAGARDLRGKAALVSRVVITRNTPRLADSDNCVGACKGTRDAIAKFLGIDDGDRRIAWCVGQEMTNRDAAGVVIRIEGRRA